MGLCDAAAGWVYWAHLVYGQLCTAAAEGPEFECSQQNCRLPPALLQSTAEVLVVPLPCGECLAGAVHGCCLFVGTAVFNTVVYNSN